jgi:hypothetical protein
LPPLPRRRERVGVRALLALPPSSQPSPVQRERG